MFPPQTKPSRSTLWISLAHQIHTRAVTITLPRVVVHKRKKKTRRRAGIESQNKQTREKSHSVGRRQIQGVGNRYQLGCSFRSRVAARPWRARGDNIEERASISRYTRRVGASVPRDRSAALLCFIMRAPLDGAPNVYIFRSGCCLRSVATHYTAVCANDCGICIVCYGVRVWGSFSGHEFFSCTNVWIISRLSRGLIDSFVAQGMVRREMDTHQIRRIFLNEKVETFLQIFF